MTFDMVNAAKLNLGGVFACLVETGRLK